MVIKEEICIIWYIDICPQVDPDNANLGLGLGLPGLKPGMADKAQVGGRGREGGAWNNGRNGRGLHCVE